MARLLPNEELRLLSKISKLYYEEGLTQDEIVEKLNLSRSKISRLLQQARERGVVQISVISPPGIYSDLESRLERRYHLHEAVVVEAREPDSQPAVSREVGLGAAAYLQRTISSTDIIGITWGTTLGHMVFGMQPRPTPGAQVVQINGGLGRPEAEVHATELCRRLARLLDCNLTLLPAPGIVDNQEIKRAFLSDSHVQRALELFDHLTVAFVGIGSPTPDSVVMRDGSILTRDELGDLVSKGAVGDIALRYFNANGEPIQSEIDQRVIGITLKQLAGVNRVVGVAGGPQKVTAIRGALRGGLINVLITDNVTAALLLDNHTPLE